MTTNFVESKRQEFLNALVAVRPRERFKVVVVDRRSLKLLNRTLKLSEILEHDVARIEKIENNRKEDPNIEALYFLTPSKQSIDSLIADFGGPSAGNRSGPGMPPGGRPKRPKYRAGHVYFTSELPDLLLARVKKAGISHHIRALKELCIEYDSHGKRIFLTRMINRPLYRLYSPLVTRGFNDELELISKKLANVCGALKEAPVVRYLLLDQETYGDTKARPLAFLFHTEMDRIRESLPKSSGDGPQTELIIVDRSADPFAPILHEFTYEAMVYDLLEIEDGCKYTYTAQLGNGEEEVKTIQLDDNDEVWQEFRYKHISEAQEGILKQFNELVGSNRAIADLQSGQQLNLNKMRDVIANMPQFKGQLSQLSAHITMMEKCMEAFKKRALNDLAMLEQNLVMGTTPDDENYVSGDIDIADMLSNPDVEMRDKLRLLLIFFIANPSLTEAERQKLASLARFSTEARETIKNMGLVLRWSHALDLLKQVQQRPNQAAKSKWALGNLRGSNSQNTNDSAKPYDLSRYTPALKNVIEGSIEGYLSEDLFPYVVPPEKPSFAGAGSLRSSGSSRTTPTAGQNNESAPSMWSTFASSVGLQSSDNRASTGSQPSPAQRQIKSLRSGRPTWQKRESSPATTSASSSSLAKSATAPSPSKQPSQGRVILFVIGGITFSEIRAAEEVSRKTGREVIVGSTHMIEPEDFLYEVSTLSFEIMGSGGRRIDIKPSLFAFGYGGPAEVDPLILYDGDADVPTWRSKPSAKEEQLRDQHRSHGSSSSESQYRSGRGHDSYEARGHDRSRSRGHNQHPSSRSATPDYRSHGSAPPMQHRGGRPDPYHSSSTSSSDYRRAHPNSHGSSDSRDHGHGSRSSPHQGHMRAERSASPAVYRGDSRADGTQNFRAGYEEYKQQQRMQQQQVMRSKSSHASLNNSARPAQPLPSKEDVFRAKFERSQQEWNAQRSNPAHVNPETIPDMHKISLNSGRGRSGSSGGSEKPSFLKRYM
ncbi:syntaxin binding protein 1 [Coemansia sp. RSA 1290]|nr:syntaxin binding protein 1 [Coemansia sp. RSA 1290]KAJ2650353.1 syntaxin binding protein 1 [Coemansia sp. RSA 1250]